MRYVEGFDNNYGGDNIKLRTKDLIAGPGAQISNGGIQLDPEIIKFQLIPILKEELKTCGLDIEQLNKLLKGNTEDREVAYELLKTRTKYSERIVRNLIGSWDSWAMMQLIREYVQNNSKELNTEIL